MSYEYDPLAPVAKEAEDKPEAVTLDTIVASATSDRVRFATTMDMVASISGLDPKSENTIYGLTLDNIGYDVETKQVEGEEEGVTEDTIVFDDDAFEYSLAVTLDFISTLGVSDTAIDDLLSSDTGVASDELHNIASLINDTTADSIDVPTLISMSMDREMIADAMKTEDATFDSILGANLEDVTMDWAFSKGGKPEARENGHVMKVVKCTRRGKDGKVSNGYCRYPKSLLKGKYKKSTKKPSPDQKIHLNLLKQSPRDKQWRERISKTMKMKAKSSSKA